MKQQNEFDYHTPPAKESTVTSRQLRREMAQRNHESKIFDTSTIQGLEAAERYQARLYSKYESVNVYAIGLYRVQIVGLRRVS